MNTGPDARTETPLSSWKEIAAYLQRNVATVRRWEKSEGLPIHRHSHQSRASVYAYPSEIDGWRESRKAAPEPEPARPLWKMPAFALTMALCLVMVGNGLRPQSALAQEVSRRRVWAGPDVDRDATVTRDGRYLAFMLGKGASTDIAIRDVATGEQRRVTNQATTATCRGSVDIPLISPDGKRVVYGVWDEKERFELCVVNTSGEPTPRRLYGSDEVPFIEPSAWSPDLAQLAVSFSRKDEVARIGLLSVSDGSLRVLKSVGWGGAGSLTFSPDGKYLAYDVIRGDDLEGRDVFVLAVDGSREALLVGTGFNSVLGWSPDGKRLLFLTDRSGNLDIWAAPVEGGRPQGAPARILANTGNMAPNALTASGELYYAVTPQRGQQVRLAHVDFSAGTLTPVGAATYGTAAEWSPDGQSVAFLATQPRLRVALTAIAIRHASTGEVRYLRRVFSFIGAFQWTPDGRSFTVWGSIPNRGYGIYRVDSQSGNVSPIAKDSGGAREFLPPFDWSPDQRKIYHHKRVYRDDQLEYVSLVERTLATGVEKELKRLPGMATQLAVSPDGRKLYYRVAIPNNRNAFFSIDLASGQETELIHGVAGLNLSPDGRYIATVNAGAGILIPADGGPPKELLAAGESQSINVAMWAPDSKSVFFRKGSPGGQAELWRVPASGTTPQKTGVTLPFTVPMRGSPDGRHIAYVEDSPQEHSEIWVLENFLPSPK